MSDGFDVCEDGRKATLDDGHLIAQTTSRQGRQLLRRLMRATPVIKEKRRGIRYTREEDDDGDGDETMALQKNSIHCR